jgi:hypothetical protein
LAELWWVMGLMTNPLFDCNYQNALSTVYCSKISFNCFTKVPRGHEHFSRKDLDLDLTTSSCKCHNTNTVMPPFIFQMKTTTCTLLI